MSKKPKVNPRTGLTPDEENGLLSCAGTHEGRSFLAWMLRQLDYSVAPRDAVYIVCQGVALDLVENLARSSKPLALELIGEHFLETDKREGGGQDDGGRTDGRDPFERELDERERLEREYDN